MTDLATRNEAETPAAPEGAEAAAATAVIDGPTNGSGEVAWAPDEEKPKRRHLGLWIGIPAAIVVVGAVVASTVLIAPGVAVAGVPVGGLTAGAAADSVSAQLARTEIVLAGPDGDVTVTAADLGATVDAKALTGDAFAEHPMWKVGSWNPEPIDAPVILDEERATETLHSALPGLFVAPVDAGVTFDADAGSSGAYVATPAEPGSGVDLDALSGALSTALASGEGQITVDAQGTEIAAPVTTAAAEDAAGRLNGMLEGAGFYVGDDRAVPLKRATVASWLTVETDDAGEFQVTADQGAIQDAVDALAGNVDREAIDSEAIVDSDGNVLQTIIEGQTGRTIGDTGGIAEDFAAQLAGGAKGDSHYGLNVEEVAFESATLFRRIEVDISSQQVFLYENEKVVQSWAVSSGLPGHDTDQGHFRVYGHYVSQNMGDPELEFADYFTPNVPWVTYFNGDEAFHGAYWHNNFGNQMSHGCVNMTLDSAKFLFDWAPVGTEVWVHA